MRPTKINGEPNAMPRKRQHLSAAERQAAYRNRHAHKKPPRKLEMAQLAFDLAAVVRIAAMQGSELAKKVNHTRDDEVIKKLIQLLSNEQQQ